MCVCVMQRDREIDRHEESSHLGMDAREWDLPASSDDDATIDGAIAEAAAAEAGFGRRRRGRPPGVGGSAVGRRMRDRLLQLRCAELAGSAGQPAQGGPPDTAGYSIGQPAGPSVSAGRPRPAGPARASDRPTGRPTGRPSDRPAVRPTDRSTERQSPRTTYSVGYSRVALGGRPVG